MATRGPVLVPGMRMLTSTPDAGFLHRVLEAAPFGIWVADAEGRVTYANHRLAELLGTGVPAMLGYPIRPFVGESGDVVGADYWRDAVPGQLELRLVRADG